MIIQFAESEVEFMSPGTRFELLTPPEQKILAIRMMNNRKDERSRYFADRIAMNDARYRNFEIIYGI